MTRRRLSKLILVLGIVLSAVHPACADVIFTVLPLDGNVFGAPGSLVGWGYTLTNTDSSNWFMSTNLNSDSFSSGTPALLFDFPILAPGGAVTEAFDSVNGIGLFQLQWDLSAPVGFVNSGNFTLSGGWWDGDPLNGGGFVGDAIDTAVPYSATVTQGSSTVPEPSSLWLCLSVLSAVGCLRLIRTRSRT